MPKKTKTMPLLDEECTKLNPRPTNLYRELCGFYAVFRCCWQDSIPRQEIVQTIEGVEGDARNGDG